jgi:hypothetical protein
VSGAIPLRPNHRDQSIVQPAKRQKADLAIVAPLILKVECPASENLLRVFEIESSADERRGSLLRIVSQAHRYSCSYGISHSQYP